MPEIVLAKNRDPFFMALKLLRERAMSGAYAPGRPIVIIEEARRLQISTTPVREALAWLCGEGVIEPGPAGGFLAARLDAGAVRDRYVFRLVCLLAGLDLTTGLPTYGRSPERIGDPVRELAFLFDSLIRRAGNAILLEAYDRVRGQIRPFVSAERRVFHDVATEAAELLDTAAGDGNGALRDALRRYHERRAEAAGILSLDFARHRSDDPAREVRS